MHTIEVKNVVLQHSPADNKEMLNFEVDILRDGVVLCQRFFLYDPETSQEQFVSDMVKVRQTFDADYETEKQSKKLENAQKNAENLQSLIGQTI